MRSFDSDNKNTMGKIVYGSLFVALLPALIVFWGRGIDRTLRGLPDVGSVSLGWVLVFIGFGLVAAGWWALIWYGKGMPMNAYPPKLLVKRGIYAVIPHPIYIGFTIMTAGYFTVARSGAGLWLVTPCLALGAAALVLGYERHDLKKRFGEQTGQPFFRLPLADESAPSLADYASSYVLLFLPWLLMYEAAIFLGPARGAVESYLAFERTMPVAEWTEAVYGFTYFFVLAAPLFSKTKKDLRRFMIKGMWATALSGFSFFLFPLAALPRPFQASSLLGNILLWERSLDGPAAAFPSFHVIWSFLAAWLYGRSLSLKVLWYAAASAIALSCVTTGMHSLLDVLAGLVIFVIVLNGERLWHSMLRVTERVANSWREWRIGSVRIIVHGTYVGAGAGLGVLIAAHLAGAQNVRFVLIVCFASLIGAGVWGQAIEGSSKLSRPFGYYGGLIGGAAGVLVSTILGADGWVLAGAFSVAAPFTQALGRIRCLVQGCCHGRECGPRHGIRFTHERSRVLYLAGLGHRPVYPTQLYSILYNIVLGAILIRAWTLSAPMPLIAGTYLILGSLGRFVEESYRGEPQTPKIAGLALYQWLALIGVVCGAVLTTVNGRPCAAPAAVLPWIFVYSAVFGLITAFAMGVDFPESNRRFSRLA